MFVYHLFGFDVILFNLFNSDIIFTGAELQLDYKC